MCKAQSSLNYKAQIHAPRGGVKYKGYKVR